ncbi:MAG TPA: COX15/CtaA family protein [Mycobacteriales bacterium]|nr:COX15/CtaA family protein [Mycobacteriales bacterium]
MGTRPEADLLRRLALASVAANCLIVVTGGAVRLTASGLGCPSWPRCTSTSYVPTAELASHGVIEFGNRLLTFVLAAIVLALLVAVVRARPRPPGLLLLAWLGALGIPAQAVLGGITVLTGLNPWTVMAHFLLSMVLISLAVWLHHRTRPAAPTAAEPIATDPPAVVRLLGFAVLAAVAAVLTIGTVVTGSGPHSGDPSAGRTGLDPTLVTQLHADAVMLLIGLTVGLLVCLHAVPTSSAVRRAAYALAAAELGQAGVGYAQHFTGLPVLLVAIHLAGACAVLVTAVRVVLVLAGEGSGAASEQLVERQRQEEQRQVADGEVEQAHRRGVAT